MFTELLFGLCEGQPSSQVGYPMLNMIQRIEAICGDSYTHPCRKQCYPMLSAHLGLLGRVECLCGKPRGLEARMNESLGHRYLGTTKKFGYLERGGTKAIDLSGTAEGFI